MSIMRAVFVFASTMAAIKTSSASSATATSSSGSSSTSTLRYIEDLPQNIIDAIVADATGGFAGPGYPILDDSLGQYNVLGEGDAGTLCLSGTFQRNDNAVLPASTAVFLYLDDGVDGTDYVRGQGVIDHYTGEFSARVTRIPRGYGRVIFSFVVADPADATADIGGANSVFALYAVNNGCSRSLTISLIWDTDNSDLDLYVVEPSGARVNYVFRIGDVGFLEDDNTEGYGPENYIVFSGLDVTEDPVLGDYTVQVYRPYVSSDTTWVLTARINGEVVWIQTDRFGDGRSDDSSSTYDYKSDIFVVSLTEYNTRRCNFIPGAGAPTVPPILAAVDMTSSGQDGEVYP